MKTLQLIAITIVSLLTLSTCDKEAIELSDFECIGTFEEFAYYPNEWDESIQDAFPSTPWEVETKLPAETEPYAAPSVEVSRQNAGESEIWIQRKLSEGTSQHNEFREYYLYRKYTEEIVSVSVEIEGVEIWVDNLFVASDGSLWGRNVWNPGEDYLIDEIPILSRFNDETRKFEFDRDGPTIPLQLKPNKVIDQVEIILDTSDVFWLLIPNEGLFRYAPLVKEIDHILDLADMNAAVLTLAPDGSIYFINVDNRIGLQDGEIYQYIPSSDQLISIKAPDVQWPMIRNMLIDQKGQLWLGSVGWMDQGGVWNLMYPNPEEYFESIETNWFLIPPRIIFESSNGLLWFNYLTYENRGVAVFDPLNGERCWFTTEFTNVIEDSENVMWMVADGYLFSLDLFP